MDLEEAKQRLSEISDEISKDEEQLRELDAKLAELAPGLDDVQRDDAGVDRASGAR